MSGSLGEAYQATTEGRNAHAVPNAEGGAAAELARKSLMEMDHSPVPPGA
jgi:hypothetical protein